MSTRKLYVNAVLIYTRYARLFKTLTHPLPIASAIISTLTNALVVLYVHVNDCIREMYNISIGPGTKHAFGITLECAAADELVDYDHGIRINSLNPTSVYIVCDSSFTIGAVTKNFKVKASPTITPLLIPIKRR